MAWRLTQFVDKQGKRAVALRQDDAPARLLSGAATTYELAQQAIAAGSSLLSLAQAQATGEEVDLAAALADGRVLPPLDHPDAAHLLVAGTGLTHLGSAEGRDKMHRDLADPAKQTDSMRMFRMGLDGGKPAPGQVGVQPEWFYKGDGSILARPDGDLVSPFFALDGGEEPEIAGLYIVGPDGSVFRLGYALGNEFSDHVTERQNYLYLAHSKLRVCAIGPELLLGDLPADVRGTTRIVRDGQTVWEKPFLSGEANMSHSLSNLEYHHFKYDGFRRPGDVHVHYFGTATLSFSDGFQTQPGDVFEVEAAPFGLPLRNRLAQATPVPVVVKAL
ncbi:AraD1 family protein [Niveispirillum cyanobacteriorum]|uniref:FAH family protein n=1 Tax=Niveispirillum cyanobacteriorum TaxID=1612173 RepID=A0A2K9NJG2_9PROT|nr:AraD1 family protein [Niveispirillum cyanobacteriorum]AUN33212.1 FAH family protein [Niveispirillum cyanobacteriorum]GGE50728.1 fumarylacetoacetate (FAA) hydrolase [Niveispirillum cyanobacteriorum]